MNVSELPWDRASPDCREFVQWKRGENWLSTSPWSKLDHLAIAVLRKLLHPQPSQRLGIPGIRDHRWCTKRYSQSKGYFRLSAKTYLVPRAEPIGLNISIGNTLERLGFNCLKNCLQNGCFALLILYTYSLGICPTTIRGILRCLR